MQYFTLSDDETAPAARERPSPLENLTPQGRSLQRALVHIESPALDVPALQTMEGGPQTPAWVVDIPTVQEQPITQLHS